MFLLSDMPARKFLDFELEKNLIRVMIRMISNDSVTHMI